MPTAPAKPRSLTVDSVVDAAQALIEADGFEALSMRKLADRCGVAPMTLYGYVRTKEELLAHLADRFLGEWERPEVDLPWEEQVKELFRSVHRVFQRHPELADIVARQHLNAMSAFRGAEYAFEAFHKAGLDPEQQVSAFVALTSYTAGFSQREHHKSSRDQRLARVGSLPPEEFGHLPALATVFVAELTDCNFEDGLDLLVRGIASRAKDTSK